MPSFLAKIHQIQLLGAIVLLYAHIIMRMYIVFGLWSSVQSSGRPSDRPQFLVGVIETTIFIGSSQNLVDMYIFTKSRFLSKTSFVTVGELCPLN